MSAATLEKRLAAVESAVADLQRRLDQVQQKPDWFEHMSGSMKDFPDFDEVLRLGREIRQADRPSDAD